MEHYAGIDVSLELSSVCVVDAAGRVVREAKVASEPEALVGFFGQLGLPLTRIGLEAGPLSQWLHAGLAEAGFDLVKGEILQEKKGGDVTFVVTHASMPPTSQPAEAFRRTVRAAVAVVDAQGRTHDIPNLYVFDGSVWPTSAGRARSRAGTTSTRSTPLPTSAALTASGWSCRSVIAPRGARGLPSWPCCPRLRSCFVKAA